MSIFNIKDKDIEAIKERRVLEKEIHELTEDNLGKIFYGLVFVAKEFVIGNFKIDTLAFNKETNSFVIIEYKRGGNFSVIDQGVAYFKTMLNQKGEFLAEYNEAKNFSLRRQDIDWSQSKIIFIAESFNAYQQSAIGFQGLPIELWEVKFFDHNLVSYNRLMSSQKEQSISFLSNNEKVKEISKEIKSYSVEDHLRGKSEVIKGLFYTLQEKIKGLGSDVREEPQKFYIAYKTNTNFIDIEVQARQLKIWLNLKSGDIQDPKSMADDMTNPKRAHNGNGDYEIKISSEEEMPYFFGLIEQAYQKSK